MSFRAVINNLENHNTWYRTLHVLSTISEELKFTITNEKIIITSLNSTDTSIYKITFLKNFFDEYEFSPHDIIFGETGLKIITDQRLKQIYTYSFKINGNHLTTIFRKPDGDVISKSSLIINNTTTCPESLVNRLLVHIDMESSIMKEYSPQFEPIQYDHIILDLKYKQDFLTVYGRKAESENALKKLQPKIVQIFIEVQEDLQNAIYKPETETSKRKRINPDEFTSDEEINFISCNQTLLRNFLENCNSHVTEQVKFELTPYKFIITAFTKAVYGKNNDILRNVINMSNQFNVSNLEGHCTFELGDASITTNNNMTTTKNGIKSRTFSLREFKNFLNIPLPSKNSINYQGTVNIWYCKNGDPIFMEMKKPNVVMQLIQLTESDLENVVPKSNVFDKASKREVLLPPPQPATVKRVPSFNDMPLIKSRKPSHEKNLFVPDDEYSQEEPPLFNNQHETDNNNNTVMASYKTTQEEGSVIGDSQLGMNASMSNTDLTININNQTTLANRSNTTIGWGVAPVSKVNDNSKEVDLGMERTRQKNMLKKERLLFLRGLKRQNEAKQREREKKAKRMEEENVNTNDNDNENGFGPTQDDTMKGLFD
ncbi:hypothetical protein TBLA_0A01940 [Henningerozyma blattae CBS 6284]|uniref:DNA damage checkpoint protein 1 n=1 Tax=Henningerozyma blattae (strain ATCC 34711 / CBS 6284 / DSM 70876 / NBRC 10599 / NRRL Y-10934 / UCD 77-7) TaxID=1071380 RepID=I2GV43_HENB6|nr:hypothetical protein TBLA_0A01940 [Tetrapisispora blattae CBS 6284]CCH57995.1 hypothetical protein TBLA_0A01940 [Tetrapisispora blattae CBS 6284]